MGGSPSCCYEVSQPGIAEPPVSQAASASNDPHRVTLLRPKAYAMCLVHHYPGERRGEGFADKDTLTGHGDTLPVSFDQCFAAQINPSDHDRVRKLLRQVAG